MKMNRGKSTENSTKKSENEPGSKTWTGHYIKHPGVLNELEWFRASAEEFFLHTGFYLDVKGRNLDTEKFLCSSSSVQVLPLDVTTPRDSYA